MGVIIFILCFVPGLLLLAQAYLEDRSQESKIGISDLIDLILNIGDFLQVTVHMVCEGVTVVVDVIFNIVGIVLDIIAGLLEGLVAICEVLACF